MSPGQRARSSASGSRRFNHRLAISIVASVLVHGGLLAWVSFRVPEIPKAPRIVQTAPAIEVAEVTPPEPPEVVIQIQPPGVLPIGSDAGTAAAQPAPEVVQLQTEPVGVPEAKLPDLAPASRGIILASAATPVDARSEVPAGAVEAPPKRPNRGIIKRPDGAEPSWASGGRGTSGSGRGSGGGGVTIAGPGTDCITAGLADPNGRIPTITPIQTSGGSSRGGLGGGRIGR